MSSYSNVELFIGGKWCLGDHCKTMPIVDPATESEIGKVALASYSDLDKALASTERGFAIWRAESAFERYTIMKKAASLLRDRADHIAWLMTREQGKPLVQAKVEIFGAADTIEWFAEEGRRTYGQIIPARMPNVSQMTIKVPVGPVAAFGPWNFPVNQIVRKMAAALAAGCSIIVKAPEETPASPAELVRTFIDAGVPGDVINLVFGVPAEISEYLIPHPTVRKISFTGSTPVGKHLASLAGKHMKRSTMELGGHAPVLIFEDADIELAISTIVAAKIRNAGQVCVSPTRFLVHKSVAKQFLDGFAKGMSAATIGNGLEPDVDMGPLANERRIFAIGKLVTDACNAGAQLITGGKRLEDKGYFFPPTVLADVPIQARIMNEEPFGPVAIVNTFTTYHEAITEANRLPFGLAAFAFTKSAARQQKLAQDVEAGMLSINHVGFGLPEVPFGGVRDSGFGTEGGSQALDLYLQTRFVTTQT